MWSDFLRWKLIVCEKGEFWSNKISTCVQELILLGARYLFICPVTFPSQTT